MDIQLPDGLVWKYFVKFFREVKGYEDWTEEEIEGSYNNDDIESYMLWLCNEIEALKIKIEMIKKLLTK